MSKICEGEAMVQDVCEPDNPDNRPLGELFEEIKREEEMDMNALVGMAESLHLEAQVFLLEMLQRDLQGETVH